MTDTIDITALLADNWGEILVLFLIFLKGVLNLIPSDKPAILFSLIDWAIDNIIPNRTKTPPTS